MSLTPLIFLGLFGLGLLATVFSHPKFGLYTYFLAFFMAPKHTWYEDDVPDFRYLLVAGVVAVAALIVKTDTEKRRHWLSYGGTKILVTFWIVLLPIYLWAVDREQHLEGIILYLKHLITIYIIYRVAVDVEELKRISIVLVIGAFWFGWLIYGKSGRIEGVAGAISNANTLGMHSVTAVLCGAMVVLGFKGTYRWVAFFCLPLVLNAVVLSGSRGAFLGLVAGGMTAGFFCPKGYRGNFAVLAVLGVILLGMVSSDQFTDRIASLFLAVDGQQSLDNSASSRFEIMAYGLEMSRDYPLGAGHKGTRSLSYRYMPARLLSQGSRSAHNSILDALVSYGYLGAGLYVWLYIWCGFRLLELRKIAQRIDNSDIGTLVALIAAVLASVFISGVFSNYVFAEVQFWALGMLVSVMNLPQIRAYHESRKQDRDLPRYGQIPT